MDLNAKIIKEFGFDLPQILVHANYVNLNDLNKLRSYPSWKSLTKRNIFSSLLRWINLVFLTEM